MSQRTTQAAGYLLGLAQQLDTPISTPTAAVSIKTWSISVRATSAKRRS